jgi:putative inorganic carbon (hco3(-)) transporter
VEAALTKRNLTEPRPSANGTAPALTEPPGALRAMSGPCLPAPVTLPFCLTFLSASSILFSIAVSQTLMALALAALLVRRQPLRFPPLRAPFVCIFFTTVLALLLSASPAGGLPQIRKFYVFTILLLIAGTFRTLRQARALLMAWALVAATSASRGMVQYLARRHEALLEHANNYDFFLDDRVRGWAGHWMTFGGEQMIVVLVLVSLLLFSSGRARLVAALSLPLILASLVLSLTRGILLLGLPAGLAYLLWRKKPAAIFLLPLAAVFVYFAAPFQVRERVQSVLRPHGDVDSNAHRVVSLRTGWEMVKAHPFFGLGPEQVGVQFDRYVPADIPRPLPHGWYGHLHNIYMQYAAERGIPGLLAMLWFILKPLADFLRALRSGRIPDSAVFLFHGAIAVIIAILAEGLVEHNLGDSEVLTMFLAAIGLAYAVLSTLQEDAPCA